MYDDITDWYINRLNNYANKLQLSKKKATKRLMLFTDIKKLRREFDRIVDQKFWSSNEPGIRHEERKKRLKAMFHEQPHQTEGIQLSLFNNNKINDHGNDFKNHRLQFRPANMLRRSIKAFGRKPKAEQSANRQRQNQN